MSEFTNFDPQTSLIPMPYVTEILGSPHSVVTRGFEYYIGDKSDQNYIYIPHGYLTDGATAPKWVRRWLPAWGKYGAATIVHDHMCEYLSMTSQGRITSVSRARSDYIFFEAMGVLGVPLYQRTLMYGAVRVYSIFKARDCATPWIIKRNLEIEILNHYNQYGNYNYPAEN